MGARADARAAPPGHAPRDRGDLVVLPGQRGLLAVSPWPEADPAWIDEEAEAEVGRLIEAVTVLRRYRDEVNAKASVAIPARLDAEGYDGLADQVARLTRFEFVSAGDGVQPLA